MKPIFTYTVSPKLPENLNKLKDLAMNLWWTWNLDAVNLFRRLDSRLWEKTNHNPVKMLGQVSQERLAEKSNDDGFVAQLERIYENFQDYLERPTWFEKQHGKVNKPLIAYFSAEFGITESLPIYSGGLGILAGDHLKSASDLGIPLVGVGLLYQLGYFRQYLNADGWQSELYPENDFYNMPIKPVLTKDNTQLYVDIPFPDRTVRAQVWKADVGRIPLFLLDTNVPFNSPQDRGITHKLYGGNLETRIQQEIILGIGGLRAIRKLNIHPLVYHLNEGHSAFLALERIMYHLERYDITFEEALEATKSGNIFTTHTPVPAGIDVFPYDLMKKYFSSYVEKLKISWEQFFALGKKYPHDPSDGFSMAVLALRLSQYSNAVSSLHAKVSRNMWKDIWPGLPVDEVPISHITNGIHPASWTSYEMCGLLDRYLGPRWKTEPGDLTIWERVEQIPGEELWRTHERRRERLVAFARRRVKEQLIKRGALPYEIEQAETVLNPEALTIGFARRFATYKRATLLFRNIERLKKICCNPKHPVQFIFAGKAHPKDMPGKELIRQIIHAIKDPDLRRHIVFIEDYDMATARYLVQGVDLWLNTPKKLQEASGTSGMKVCVNGGINISILDGWWDEAYSPDVGWAIGQGEIYQDEEYQNEVEANALYEILEKEVVPLFYTRGRDGLPTGWIIRMKSSMQKLSPVFNTHRMLKEYTDNFYLPSKERYKKLNASNMQKAKELAHWKSKVNKYWHKVRIIGVESSLTKDLKVGDTFKVTTTVYLDMLSPDDVVVEAYHGKVNSKGEITNAVPYKLSKTEKIDENTWKFTGKIPCLTSGLQGYSIRIFPQHENLCNTYEPGLIIWSTQ